MDFLEKIFGFEPDGGDGSFEMLLFAIPIAGLLVLWRWRQRRQTQQRQAGPRSKR
jgi:hypothetical protein